MSVVYKPLIGLASTTVFIGLKGIMSRVQIKFSICLLLAFRQKMDKSTLFCNTLVWKVL